MEKKKKLVWIVSILLVTGFVATSLASYFVSLTSLRSQIKHTELPLTSDNIYSEIQRDLLQPIFISSLMANDTFLRDWVIAGEAGERKITRYLKEIKEKYNAFTSFFVSEKSRAYYYADGILKRVKSDEPRDKWYFRVRTMPEDYEINVDPDMANKDLMTIFINYRVHDYAGNFIGATGVGLQVGAVKKLIRKYQESYDRNIFFVDSSGKIVLHGSQLPEGVKSLGEIQELAGLSKDILSSDKGSFNYQRFGRTVHLNVRYIKEFDWHLLVEQDEEKTVRPILNALFVNLATCGLITFIVLSLTHLTVSSYQRNLEKMATRDKLTGLYNRQAFDLFIQQILKDVQRQPTPFSIILFDIDRFKLVNDRFGHLTGDAVIQKISETVLTTIRRSDILCRWGGEEFLVLLKNCNDSQAYDISEKIRQTIEKTPALYKGQRIVSTVSLGVTQYRESDTVDALLSRADDLLYKAKENGRNRSEKADG